MKLNFAKLFSAAVLLTVITACNDENKKSDSATENTELKTEKKTDTENDKTKVSVGSEGVSVGTKSGTQVSVGEKGGEVKTKDLDIQVKPQSRPNQ